MQQKTLIVVSNMVDATIKEYQPDVDFKLFENLDALSQYLEHNPIRASILFITQECVSAAPTTSFSFLKDLTEYNDYLAVDRVIYLTTPDAEEIPAFDYLKNEMSLDNWELMTGDMTHLFVQEVINGTYRSDEQSVQHKAVIRRPRADYVADKIKHSESLEEKYPDDETDLGGIPDEELPEVEIEVRDRLLRRLYISGLKGKARTAFSLIAAQYLALSAKVLIIESDVDYHLLTEFVTKSEIKCAKVSMTDLYQNPKQAIDNMRKAKENLVVLTCIDRIDFSYNYVETLLYYNLTRDFDFIIIESEIDEVPHAVDFTCVVESTITSILETGEKLDKSAVRYAKFVGVDMGDLKETHVSSGTVMAEILQDILTEGNIVCPVIKLSSLRLGDSSYDLAAVIGGVKQ